MVHHRVLAGQEAQHLAVDHRRQDIILLVMINHLSNRVLVWVDRHIVPKDPAHHLDHKVQDTAPGMAQRKDLEFL